MAGKRLPDTEFSIMEFIWDREPPVTTTMVYEAFAAEKNWKLQTIVSYFGRLTERGFLRAERSGGKSRYFYPVITREEYLKSETENFMNQFHFKSPASLVNTLIQGTPLSGADLDELEQFIQNARRQSEQEES